MTQAELTKLTDSISKLRTERSTRETHLEELQLARFENESRIAELEDELSTITIRREATQENVRDLEAAISATNAARDGVRSEIAAARAAIETARKNRDLLKAAAQSGEERLQQRQQLLNGAEKSLVAIERAVTERNRVSKFCANSTNKVKASPKVRRPCSGDSMIQREFTPPWPAPWLQKLDVDPKFVAAIEAAWVGMCRRSFSKMRSSRPKLLRR